MLFILGELKEQGYITRNTCLKRYITRLGAYMCQLKNEGLRFEARYIKSEFSPNGQDYAYMLIPIRQKRLLNSLIKKYLDK